MTNLVFSEGREIPATLGKPWTCAKQQSCRKYLRQTQVVMRNSTLWERFNLCFSGDFY